MSRFSQTPDRTDLAAVQRNALESVAHDAVVSKSSIHLWVAHHLDRRGGSMAKKFETVTNYLLGSPQM